VNRPAVSVVVPTYNRAGTILAAIGGLLTEPVDLEVVVVDDGSTDDTAAVLAGIPDRRVRVVRAAHAGIAAARNAGIAAAAAPVIAFHDSDDLALPGRLTTPLVALDQDRRLDFVVMNGRLLPPDDDPGRAEAPWVAPSVAAELAARPLDAIDVFRWNLGQLQGITITRRALDAVGPLDGTFTILDDLDLVLRVAARGPGRFIDHAAFAYRQHAGGIARNRLRLREESIALADKLARLHPEVVDRLGRDRFTRRQARRWRRVAELRARAGDPVGAAEAWMAARALVPWHLGHWWAAVRGRWQRS
jgi:glycosyltransferase involved in cell wall biosynthesis